MVREACKFVGRHVDRWNEILIQDLKPGEWSPSLNFSHSIDNLVFDIMGDLNFGKSFDIKEPGKQPFKEVPHLITQSMEFYYPVSTNGNGVMPLQSINVAPLDVPFPIS